MDWNLAMEEERRVLERIVALLFAFAELAERLCGSSRPVRGFVLLILRGAEAIARDFVLESAQDQGASVPPFLFMPARQGGDSPADAARLARSFRVLAVLLDRLADRNIGRRRRGVTQAAGLLASLASLAAATRFERKQLCSAIERRDSS